MQNCQDLNKNMVITFQPQMKNKYLFIYFVCVYKFILKVIFVLFNLKKTVIAILYFRSSST